MAWTRRRDTILLGEVAFLLGGRRMSDVYAASDRVRMLTLSDGTLRELIRFEAQLAASSC